MKMIPSKRDVASCHLVLLLCSLRENTKIEHGAKHCVFNDAKSEDEDNKERWWCGGCGSGGCNSRGGGGGDAGASAGGDGDGSGGGGGLW